MIRQHMIFHVRFSTSNQIKNHLIFNAMQQGKEVVYKKEKR